MRFPAFGVVHLEVLLAATDPTFEIVSQLDLELPFRHVQWFLSIGNPDCVGVDVLIWAGFSQWVVNVQWYLREDVRMGKALPPLLVVSLAFQFHPGWEPLIRFEVFVPLTYLGCPPCPVVDDPGFSCDELLDSTAFVLGPQPASVAEPHVPCDFLNVTE